MVRYLNPAKIGLLNLIELYAEGAVPNEAVLPVLSFLTAYVLGHDSEVSSPTPDSRWDKVERTIRLILTPQDFEKHLSAYPYIKGMPGRKLWDGFLAKLWKINSLDSLHTFFDGISALLSDPNDGDRKSDHDESASQDNDVKLTPNSPFGIFVRRSRFEFLRMRFNDCAELWKDFVRYRQPTAQYLRRKNPNFDPLSFDNVLQLGSQIEWGYNSATSLASIAYGDIPAEYKSYTVPLTADDIEFLLEFQIQQMQIFGDRIPSKIRRRFQDLLRDSSLIPSLTHYLSFLEAWRAGDYTTSFDNLHRYFDYTIQHHDRLFYQYALMNLAVLQADFGCHQEAVSAMLETVSTARENRDMTCLNFALNWLFHFGRAHPDVVRKLEASSLIGTGKESLAFLRVKAHESGMWSLWSSVLLSEAKLALINGDSVATSLELMVRSSHIIVERNLVSMLGSQLSLHASLWGRLGLAHLSFLTSQTFLRCHARHSVFDDELKHSCRVALALAERGKYRKSLEKLDVLDTNSLRSWKVSQYWHRYKGIIKLKKDLHHNNLDGADQLIDQLLQCKEDDLEPDMAFLIDSLHIDYLSRIGDLQAAFAEVDRLTLKLQDENRDIALRVKLLLLKTSLLDKCGRPQRAFSMAVRAANIAWQARLIPSLWQAIGSLSNILVSLAEFGAAAQLLVAVIPRVLECEVPDVAARLYAFLGDAYMGIAGTMETRSTKRTEYMMKAKEALQKAFDHYSAIEDVNRQAETMAKMAMILKTMGELALSLDYSAAYGELKKRAAAMALGSE